jgi:hypothetical protein
MIDHPLFTIKETDNIVIPPPLSESFECILSFTELAWLDKKHIANALSAASEMTDELKTYNNSADIIPANDLINAILLFKKLNAKIKDLKTHNLDLEQRLKKYTNGENHKRYYEKNKEKIKETGASYLQKLKVENPEKIKEYSRRAYQNQKEKKKNKIEEVTEATVRVL